MEQQHDETTSDSGGAVVERRQTPRIQVTLDARWRRLGRPGEGEETSTVDVSHGGARIGAPAQISVGDVLQLAVQMPHGIELTLQGLVVQLSSAKGEHHAHVAFDSLSTAAADLLTELLQEQAKWQEAEASAPAGPSPSEAPGGGAPGTDPVS